MTKKTIKRASADVGLMAIAFNLCRIFDILEPEVCRKSIRVERYYAGGMQIKSLSYVAPQMEADRFTFQGKELQKDFDLYWNSSNPVSSSQLYRLAH